MIKKHLIFHSLFLLVIVVWVITILNVVFVNNYSINFLTSAYLSPFAGVFGVFYWVIVGGSAASSFVLGLDKLGLGRVIWKRLVGKDHEGKKSEVVIAPKRSKPKAPKATPVTKKKKSDKQKKVAVGAIDVVEKPNQKNINKKKDQMKAFYLFGETKFSKCTHVFGYLCDKLKNKPIPDECFGCPKLLDCFKSKKEKKANANNYSLKTHS